MMNERTKELMDELINAEKEKQRFMKENNVINGSEKFEEKLNELTEKNHMLREELEAAICSDSALTPDRERGDFELSGTGLRFSIRSDIIPETNAEKKIDTFYSNLEDMILKEHGLSDEEWEKIVEEIIKNDIEEDIPEEDEDLGDEWDDDEWDDWDI